MRVATHSLAVDVFGNMLIARGSSSMENTEMWILQKFSGHIYYILERAYDARKRTLVFSFIYLYIKSRNEVRLLSSF